MAKDPAILWYWNDWNGGTSTFSRHLKGCYIDLLHAQFNSGRLSLLEVKTVLGSDFGQVWPTIQKKFKVDENGMFYNERMEGEQNKRKAFTESRRNARLKCDEDNVRIYLIKDLDTGLIKVGSSVNPKRRFAEMVNSENPAITVGNRNYQLLWYSCKTERKIEGVIHKEFSARRIKGEWFDFTVEDLRTIQSMFERTYKLTENEIENEDKDSLKERGGVEEKTFTLPPDGFFSDTLDKEIQLTEIEVGATIQFINLLCKKILTKKEVDERWEAFKIKQFSLHEWYNSREKLVNHFRESIKYEFKNGNTNGKAVQNYPHKPVITGEAEGAGSF